MGVGIPYVLVEGTVTWEPSFTAITVRHQMVVVRSKDDYSMPETKCGTAVDSKDDGRSTVERDWIMDYGFRVT